jgi:hypothetical protein
MLTEPGMRFSGGGVLGDLFYHLGTMVGGMAARVSGKGGAEAYEPTGYGADAAGYYDPVTAGVTDLDAHPGDSRDHGTEPAVPLMASAVAAWLAARVLRPRPVSWSRVIVAGVAATFLADLAARAFQDDRADRRGPMDSDPQTLMRRYGAGVALAAGYATLLYPRLPGPALLRGLAFAAMDVAAAPHGGLIGLAEDAPALHFPLQSMADAGEMDADPMARIAFGLGLGLFYRHDSEE